jgi:CheY-like chemotaxis protein
LPISKCHVTAALDARDEDMAIRILVVGRNTETRSATSQSLSRLGYAVNAVSAVYAMAAIHLDPPDIILTEVVMADKCGIELIKEIRVANKDIRIIATAATGALDRDYVLEMARKLGADRVLAEPFHMDQLLAAIEQVLKLPQRSDRRDVV